MTLTTHESHSKSPNATRDLAIDPTSRGFGYAVIEDSERLIDWGIVHVRTDKLVGCLKRISGLIKFHQPTRLVTEDVSAKGSRRCARVKALIGEIRKFSHDHDLDLVAVSPSEVRHAFNAERVMNKHQIAEEIASHFAELRPHLPERRKCYNSEDERSSIFDAVALWWASR